MLSSDKKMSPKGKTLQTKILHYRIQKEKPPQYIFYGDMKQNKLALYFKLL
jgi:hypothetical protein